MFRYVDGPTHSDPQTGNVSEKDKFKCPNFDILCFRKYVNILYLLKNTCIVVVLLFCYKNVINKLTQGVSIHLF